MELGLDFDDCDFIQERQRKPLLKSYNAKICSPEWFLQDDLDDPHTETATLYKFRGDFHFRRRDYEKAIDCFNVSLANLTSQNRSMRREGTESLTRCYLYIGNIDKAKELADKVLEDCLTRDQNCHALILKQHIYQTSGQIRDELHILYQLINLHPRNIQFWTSLKHVYKKIEANLNTSTTNHTKDSNTVNSRLETRAEKQGCGIDRGVGDLNIVETVEPENAVISTRLKASEQLTMNDEGHHEVSNSDFSDVLSGYSCQLLKLTCCVRIRLILKGVQKSVGSFIKEKNQQLQSQIDEEIKSLCVKDEAVHKATESMKRDISEDDLGENKSDAEDDKEIPVFTTEEFNRRWFSWINDT